MTTDPPIFTIVKVSTQHKDPVVEVSIIIGFNEAVIHYDSEILAAFRGDMRQYLVKPGEQK